MQNFASAKTTHLLFKGLEPPAPGGPSEWPAVGREIRKALRTGAAPEVADGVLKSLIDAVLKEGAKYPKASAKVRACVSRKIPQLIEEGKPQDQAVAIAFSMCGGSEDPKTEKSRDVEKGTDKGLGGYGDDQAPDGPEQSGDQDDELQQRAIDIVAAALAKIDPKAASERSKRGWQTRRGERAAAEEEGGDAAPKPAGPDDETEPSTATQQEEAAGKPQPYMVPEQPKQPQGEQPLAEPAAPSAPAGGAGGAAAFQAQSQANQIGSMVAAGDLGGAAEAAGGMVSALQEAQQGYEAEGDSAKAQAVGDLLSQIEGVPQGLSTLAQQGNVNNATMQQIQQTFTDIGSAMSEIAGPSPGQQQQQAAGAAWQQRPPGEAAPAAPAAPAPAAPAAEAPQAESPGGPAEAPQPGDQAAEPAAEPAAAQPQATEAHGIERPKAPHQKKPVNPNSTTKVQSTMQANGLTNESEEMEELVGFKDTLGARGRGRTIAELKQDFVNNMDPQNYGSAEAFQNAKQRISAMSHKDFGKVLAAIFEDEEEVALPGAAGAPVGASLDQAAKSIVDRALARVLGG